MKSQDNLNNQIIQLKARWEYITTKLKETKATFDLLSSQRKECETEANELRVQLAQLKR